MREQEMQEKQVVSSEQPRGKIRSFFAKRKKKMIFAVLLALPEILFILTSRGEDGWKAISFKIFVSLLLLVLSYLFVCFLIVAFGALVNNYKLFIKNKSFYAKRLCVFFLFSLWVIWVTNALPLEPVVELFNSPLEWIVYSLIYIIEVLIIFYFSSVDNFCKNIYKFLSIQMIMICLCSYASFMISEFAVYSIIYDILFTPVYMIVFFVFEFSACVLPFSWSAFLFCPVFSYLFYKLDIKAKHVSKNCTTCLFLIALFNAIIPDLVIYFFKYTPEYPSSVLNLLHNYPPHRRGLNKSNPFLNEN